MKTRIYVWISRVVLVASVLGWPISAVTFAKDEPPAILGLSWFAIIYTAFGVLVTVEVKQGQEEGGRDARHTEDR